jgi:multidrug resistance protein
MEEPSPESKITIPYVSTTSNLSIRPGSTEKEMGKPSRKDEEAEISTPISRTTTISEYNHEPNTSSTPASRPNPPKTISRTTSVTQEAVIIERRNRNGLFAHLSLIPEVQDPYHYARRTKWFITTIVAVCGMAGPMGSAIVLPVLRDIRMQFHASEVIANMSVAVYMLALGIFPLWWSSFSESSGRRTIYIISFTLFVVFGVLSAVSTNISMLIVVRTLAGGASASVQAVGGGTIADIWEVKERGKAMGFFYLGPLMGPLLGPLIGGGLGQGLGWRSTQWFLAIYGAVTVLLILFALPETLRSKKIASTIPQTTTDTSEKTTARPELARAPTRQSVQKKTKSFLSHIHRFFIEPLVVLTWMRYPPVALTVYYASITFGSLYFLNISIQATFAASPYNFSTSIVGCLYIPNSLGYLLASIFGGRWIDSIMQREARKAGRYDEDRKLILKPEDRMRENAWIAAVLWPGALLWYGWTAEKGVFWLVPMIANFFFGVGSMLIFSMATTMLTEFMPKQASSGIAINSFLRSMFAFAGSVLAEPLINAIGNGWLFTILGLWSLGSGLLVIWTMLKWGPAWREDMVKIFG